MEPRVGVVVSSGLYRDAGVEGLEPVEIAPAPALEAALLARTTLSPLWALEAELSYAMGSLEATGEEDDRRVSDLRVVAGTLRLRRSWHGVEGVVGVGGLSYDAPDAQAYAEGSAVFPAGVIGIAIPLQAVGQRIRIEALARVHRHQTPVLERAGAEAGLVARGGIQVGVAFGGER